MSLFSPCFSCGALINNYIYASAYKYNAIVKVKIDDGKAEYMFKFPQSDLIIKNQHSRAYVYNNKIFFCPAMGDYIHVFDPFTYDIVTIGIDRENYKGEYYGLLYRDAIILIPKTVGGDVLSFNMDSMETVVLLKWVEVGSYFAENAQYAFLRIVQLNDAIYLPIYNTSIILVLNMDSLTIEKKEVDVDELLGAVGGGNGIYLLSNSNSSVYKWDPVDNKVKKYLVDEVYEKSNVYTFAIEQQGNTYFFPGYSYPYIGNMQSDRIASLLKLDVARGKLLFLEPIYGVGKVWALPFQGNEMICISENAIVKKKITPIKIDNISKEKIIKNEILSGRLFLEGEDFTMDEYIQGIV